MAASKVKEKRFLVYAPDTPNANRFPWRMFLSQTKLNKGDFKRLFRYEEFLKATADAYENKDSILTDDEVFQCVEEIYFPIFSVRYIEEDVLWVGESEDSANMEHQPQIQGYILDRNPISPKAKVLRDILRRFSKDLYGDSHAWFSDFEAYFRAQQNPD